MPDGVWQGSQRVIGEVETARENQAAEAIRERLELVPVQVQTATDPDLAERLRERGEATLLQAQVSVDAQVCDRCGEDQGRVGGPLEIAKEMGGVQRINLNRFGERLEADSRGWPHPIGWWPRRHGAECQRLRGHFGKGGLSRQDGDAEPCPVLDIMALKAVRAVDSLAAELDLPQLPQFALEPLRNRIIDGLSRKDGVYFMVRN